MQHEIAQIVRETGATSLAAAFYDYETETAWGVQGDRWFHAASTIKVAVLVALFGAIEEGRFTLDSRLHVRNRFQSVVDGQSYRIEPGRDANSAVHAAIGKTMRIKEFAHHMIVTSSNLATNLLLDLVGIERAREYVERLGLTGLDLRRGVEDDKAHEADINNRVTANGLVSLFRLIQEGRAFSPEASLTMLDILHEQEFKSGIPAGLPGEVRGSARIAHKTGEISTVAHDAGLVFLPKRKPYAIAILTEWSKDASGRQETVARISRTVYAQLTGEEASGNG